MKNAFLNICLAFCILWLLVQIAECSFGDETSTNAYIDTVQVNNKGHDSSVGDTVPSINANAQAAQHTTFEDGYKEGHEDGHTDAMSGSPYRHSHKILGDEHSDYAKGYIKGYDEGYKEAVGSK